MPRLAAISVLLNYRLRVRYADGAEGVVDLSDMVGKGVFAAWQDERTFAAATIDAKTGAVTWPGGLDLCPDSLYQEITGRSALDASSPGRAG